MQMLKNYQKPFGYKYYNYFVTKKGDFVIWSRDGKRYYIDATQNTIFGNIISVRLPNTPFKSPMKARNYLKKLVNKY